MVKAKNEEIFSLREKNRKKDIQIVLLKDEKLKNVRLKDVIARPNKGQITRSSTPPIRSAPPKMNGQMRAVLPVNGGQVVNKVHQVNGGHLIPNVTVTNGGQIVRKVQNVNNLNQLKLPAGSKLIQVGNQKLPVTPVVTKFPATNATQFTSGFNQPIRMVRKLRKNGRPIR